MPAPHVRLMLTAVVSVGVKSRDEFVAASSTSGRKTVPDASNDEMMSPGLVAPLLATASAHASAGVGCDGARRNAVDDDDFPGSSDFRLGTRRT